MKTLFRLITLILFTCFMISLSSCGSTQNLDTHQDFVVRAITMVDNNQCEYILSTVKQKHGTIVVIDDCRKHHVSDTVQIERKL